MSSLLKKGFVTALLIGLSLGFAGCANTSGIAAQKLEGSGGLTLLLNQRADAGDGALLVGKLEVSSAGCIGVGSEQGFVYVAFPNETSYEQGKLKVPGSDLSYQLGDLILLSGGNSQVTPEIRSASNKCIDSSISTIFFAHQAELNSATS